MTNEITKYSAGFAFDNDKLLGLIKNRPSWQAGRRSVPGGHCEPGEHNLQTLVREFYEETGLRTVAEQWTLFAVLTNETEKFQVHFYKSNVIDIALAETMTDEPIFIDDIQNFTTDNSLNNISWLIQMAKSIDTDRANFLEIYER